VHTGDVRVDVQAALAMLAPIWGYRPLLDSSDAQARADLARASVMALSYVAQSARGIHQPAVPQDRIDRCSTITERFMTRWRGDPDPAQVKAVDAYWVAAAEHGLNASTLTARVIASTGADVAACLSGAIGAMSGPLHGGAPARVLPMIEQVERNGDPAGVVRSVLDRGERLMGFGHRVYRAQDPRARVLRRLCLELGAPRYEAAIALERAALAALAERRPDRAIETNVEFWAAVILDFAQVPAHMMAAMFTCARTAGWCAHIMEQKRTGRLVRPTAQYVGPEPRRPEDVPGWSEIAATH
jgi:citrate synthase